MRLRVSYGVRVVSICRRCRRGMLLLSCVPFIVIFTYNSIVSSSIRILANVDSKKYIILLFLNVYSFMLIFFIQPKNLYPPLCN